MVVKDKKMDVVAFQRRSNCSRSPSFRINAASLSPLRLNKMRSVIVTATLLFLMMAFNIKSIYALDTSKIYFYVFLINCKNTCFIQSRMKVIYVGTLSSLYWKDSAFTRITAVPLHLKKHVLSHTHIEKGFSSSHVAFPSTFLSIANRVSINEPLSSGASFIITYISPLLWYIVRSNSHYRLTSHILIFLNVQ